MEYVTELSPVFIGAGQLKTVDVLSIGAVYEYSHRIYYFIAGSLKIVEFFVKSGV